MKYLSPFRLQIDFQHTVNLGASTPFVDWGSPFLFGQPGTLRRADFGLHFILAQSQPAANRRLARTLAITNPPETPMVLLRRILLKPSILLLLYSSNVIGANWAYVVSADTLKVWVDTDSLRSSGTRVKAWAKWVYSQPVLIAASDPKLYFRSMMSLSIYQCDDRTGAEIQVLTYSDADATESIRTRTYPDIPSRYQDVVPESVGEKVHLFVCKASAASRK